MPESIEALQHGHRMVGFRSSLTGSLIPLEFTVGGEVRHVVLPTTMSGSCPRACASSSTG
uniref:hypothetical protein n=1 Tax=Corallococcus coralloides TaxID=184914 RepID=UPI00196AF039|nr:hypothetical protein [Corallococcus coralloides]